MFLIECASKKEVSGFYSLKPDDFVPVIKKIVQSVFISKKALFKKAMGDVFSFKERSVAGYGN